MKAKPLWKISISTTPEAEDAVAEMLGSVLAAPASAYFNLESGISTVTVYCDAKPPAGIRQTIVAGLAQIKQCGLKIGNGRMTAAKIRREDWAESWKRHFKPLEFGTALLIKPSWSRRKPQKRQAVVVLDPGLSFGTGQHPTTSFCLHQIVRSAGGPYTSRGQFRKLRASRPRSSFLDIGTGSGILAIAAAKLGCQPVHAFDFDANAVEIARVNANRNRVAGKIRLWRGDVARLSRRPARKYDLICANLISDLLITERRRIGAQLNPGGLLVLAGILKSEFGKVRRAFEASGLKLISSRTGMEWQSGAFRRA
jgi:ribosomal protein L11 methyltransferase